MPTHPKKRIRRYLGYAVILTALITLIVWVISQYIQPVLPPNVNNAVILLFAALLGVLGGLAAFKDVIELIQILLIPKPGSSSQVPVPDTRPYLALSPLPPKPYFVHPYSLSVNFTGRHVERKLLTDWLFSDSNPILIMVAVGGMGKSSLAWYWLQNDVSYKTLDGLLWWSFYEKGSSFSGFLNEMIAYASSNSVDPRICSSDYDKTQLLLKLLQQSRILIVLDGFERRLHSYAGLSAAYQSDEAADETPDARACIDPDAARFLRGIASGITRSKILITSRLMVNNLEDKTGNLLVGCKKQELGALTPADAVKYMHLQGITKGTKTEIAAICELYGYHPLSLQLVAGQISHDKQSPGDIATAPKHNVLDDLISRRHHVLAGAYAALPKDLQKLLSRMAAFRGPIDYKALRAYP